MTIGRPKLETPTKMTAMRIPVDKLERIDELAAEFGMTRTAFMVASALGELPTQLPSVLERFETVHERLDRLETFAFGG